MAGDGLEKVTEIPVEFIKEGTTFLNRCTKPDSSGMSFRSAVLNTIFLFTPSINTNFFCCDGIVPDLLMGD
jgi:hypothetical protein